MATNERKQFFNQKITDDTAQALVDGGWTVATLMDEDSEYEWPTYPHNFISQALGVIKC